MFSEMSKTPLLTAERCRTSDANARGNELRWRGARLQPTKGFMYAKANFLASPLLSTLFRYEAPRREFPTVQRVRP